ncbi:MAG: acyl-CoA dehydrogenase family protein [Pigmentiphaga sp.]|nr:acyl-CoA dehydrogenase family protein [Pigmentiphaga sp.]
MMSEQTEPLPLAVIEVLASLRSAFDEAVRVLAHACAPAGRLQPDRLDEQQVAAFELAWAGAELLAAETAVAACKQGKDPLEARLALTFTVEAVGNILDRLETLYVETGLDLARLHALRTAPPWLELRRGAGSAAFLQATGQGVIDAQGLVGEAELDEQHAMAQAAFRRFAEAQVAPLAEAIHRQDLTVPESLLQPMREMGVFGLAIPEQYGGSAPDDHDDTLLMVVVTEALSEASLAAAGSLITRPEILTRALLAGGTPAQKAHWLPRLATGETLCAIAMTEPDCGSDLAACGLKASPVADGWLLNGAKTWCTFAGKAGVLMIVARTATDPALAHRGLSVILAEKPSFDTREFEIVQAGGGKLSGRAIPTIGYRGMHSFDLSFQDYVVPHDAVLGGQEGLGRGFYYTLAGMVGGRIQTSARACGVMRAALRAAVRYVQDRRVFGAPLAGFALTQAKLARMGARLAACRYLTYTMAGVVDGGQGQMEASLVKLLACRSAEMLTREALQLHGGMGYAEESAVSRYFVDARVLSIFEGAEETLALKVVSRGLMERALSRIGEEA